jgi:hypothetical protein
METRPNFLVACLEIMAMDAAHIAIRQAAAAYAKNTVDRRWAVKQDPSFVSIAEADKVVVRENILAVLIRSPPLVRCVQPWWALRLR